MQKPQPAGEYSEDALSGSETAEFTPESRLSRLAAGSVCSSAALNLPSEDLISLPGYPGRKARLPQNRRPQLKRMNPCRWNSRTKPLCPTGSPLLATKLPWMFHLPLKPLLWLLVGFLHRTGRGCGGPSAQEAEPAEEVPSWMSDVFEPKFGIEEKGPVSEGFQKMSTLPQPLSLTCAR